jgi:hypothetical protein
MRQSLQLLLGFTHLQRHTGRFLNSRALYFLLRRI